jgi:hypothetical protein
MNSPQSQKLARGFYGGDIGPGSDKEHEPAGDDVQLLVVHAWDRVGGVRAAISARKAARVGGENTETPGRNGSFLVAPAGSFTFAAL